MNSYTTAVLIYDLIIPLFFEKSREKWQKCKRYQIVCAQKPVLSRILASIFFQIFYLFLCHAQGTLIFAGVIGSEVVRS